MKLLLGTLKALGFLVHDNTIVDIDTAISWGGFRDIRGRSIREGDVYVDEEQEGLVLRLIHEDQDGSWCGRVIFEVGCVEGIENDQLLLGYEKTAGVIDIRIRGNITENK